MSIILRNEAERIELLDQILNPRHNEFGKPTTPTIATLKGQHPIKLHPSASNLSFLNEFDVEGLDCITTGSSCENLLSLIAKGARRADLFDINPFAKDFFELKKQAILHLPRKCAEGFLLCHPSNLYFLDPTMFEKIAPHLSSFHQKFWRKVVDSPNKFNLFQIDRQSVFIPAIFSNKEIFARLKENLLLCETHFYELSLAQLYHTKHSYDIALLSNISDWYPSADKFIIDIEKLIPTLSREAKIQIGYHSKNSQHKKLAELLAQRFGDAIIPLSSAHNHSTTLILDKAEMTNERLFELSRKFYYSSSPLQPNFPFNPKVYTYIAPREIKFSPVYDKIEHNTQKSFEATLPQSPTEATDENID